MRRAGARFVAAARQTGLAAVQDGPSAANEAATCSNRAVWLRPPGGQPAAGASPAAAPSLRAAWIATSSASRHNAEQAREAAPAAAAAEPPPREAERTCWQCGTPLAPSTLFFCPECQSVQPASMDAQYFRVFGMDKPRFTLDLPALEQRYRALQRSLHPDKYAAASPLERDFAEQQAAAVNQAHDVLKRPLRRAHYILNLRGFGACEGMTITDPELLGYVMEAREEVESAAPGDSAALGALLAANRALEERCLQELTRAFDADDLQQAAELTTQLRYICRIKEAIVEKM